MNKNQLLLPLTKGCTKTVGKRECIFRTHSAGRGRIACGKPNSKDGEWVEKDLETILLDRRDITEIIIHPITEIPLQRIFIKSRQVSIDLTHGK